MKRRHFRFSFLLWPGICSMSRANGLVTRKGLVAGLVLLVLTTSAFRLIPGSANQPSFANARQGIPGNNNLAYSEQLQSGQPQVGTNQIILKYKSKTSAFAAPAKVDQMARLNNVAGVPLQFFRRMSGNANVLRLPDMLPLDQVQKITKLLATLPEVQYAEPDQRLFPILSPNDTYYVAGDQWDMNNPIGGINAPAAWDITTGSANIVVADVDTGLTDHPLPDVWYPVHYPHPATILSAII